MKMVKTIACLLQKKKIFKKILYKFKKICYNKYIKKREVKKMKKILLESG